ncbi:hypothetical protein TELCIR_10371, partial [Teladorsagia circumcincta]
VYKGLGNNLLRQRHIQRLHLFPDMEMPDFVRENLGNQLEQIQRVPKRSDEYTPEERARFSRLLRFPADHVEKWERSIPNPGRYEKPGLKGEPSDYETGTTDDSHSLRHKRQHAIALSGRDSDTVPCAPHSSPRHTSK